MFELPPEGWLQIVGFLALPSEPRSKESASRSYSNTRTQSLVSERNLFVTSAVRLSHTCRLLYSFCGATNVAFWRSAFRKWMDLSPSSHSFNVTWYAFEKPKHYSESWFADGLFWSDYDDDENEPAERWEIKYREDRDQKIENLNEEDSLGFEYYRNAVRKHPGCERVLREGFVELRNGVMVRPSQYAFLEDDRQPWPELEDPFTLFMDMTVAHRIANLSARVEHKSCAGMYDRESSVQTVLFSAIPSNASSVSTDSSSPWILLDHIGYAPKFWMCACPQDVKPINPPSLLNLPFNDVHGGDGNDESDGEDIGERKVEELGEYFGSRVVECYATSAHVPGCSMLEMIFGKMRSGRWLGLAYEHWTDGGTRV